jgi:hypothetical protein
MKRLVAVLLLLFPSAALARPVVSEADLSGSSDQARVELVMTGAPQFHVTYFANPYRIVIDMDAVDWRAAPVGAIAKTSLVIGLRYGVQKSGSSRLVLDLAAPARMASARYRAEKTTDRNGSKTHLILSLQAASATNFRQAMNRQQPTPQAIDAAAAMVTAAGKPVARPATKTATQAALVSGNAAQGVATSGRAATGDATQAAKPADCDPLLTDLDTATLQSEPSTSEGNGLGYASPDGYFVSYMHPPGSLLGAGVTVGTQF